MRALVTLVAGAILSITLSLFAAPGIRGVFGAALSLLMLTIIVYDYRYYLIPDVINVSALALGLCNAAIVNDTGPIAGIVLGVEQGIAVAGCFLLIRFVYGLIRHREGIGMGDVKLAAVAGVWLNLFYVPVSIEFAALAALATYLFTTRAKPKNSHAFAKIPFGAFFAPAIWVCWLLDATTQGGQTS